MTQFTGGRNPFGFYFDNKNKFYISYQGQDIKVSQADRDVERNWIMFKITFGVE